MKKLLAVAGLIFFLAIPTLPQIQNDSGLKDGVFSSKAPIFRYTPPKGLTDETADARESVREKAAALHTTNTLDVLLSMTSGPDDTAPDWHSIGIETYPRSKFAALDDNAALAKINVWVAGAGVTVVGDPERVSISGHHFIVSTFERSEPPLLKHARVYSIIRDGKLISFAFAANSADKLPPLAESLQTVQFAGETPVSYLGFDRNEYPENNLKELRQIFSYSGYWLNNPPGTNVNTWSGKRSKLEADGFGFMVLFNGRLYRELGSVGHASELGKADAQAAVQAAKREGFPARTIIFLDQEEGGRLLPEQKAYLFAWVDGVIQARFRAGVYCSGIAAQEKDGARVVTAEDIRQNAAGRDISYWVTNDACPPSPGCVASGRLPEPKASGIDFAEVWQFAQSPRRKDVASGCRGYDNDRSCYLPATASGHELDVDLNVSSSVDPSHGRTSKR